MPKDLDELNDTHDVVASPMPRVKDYPLHGGEARDAAIRRLSYRGVKAPIEYEIWQEFHQFPEVLGAYVTPSGGIATVEQEAEFQWRFDWNRQERERRIYGRVLTPVERGPVPQGPPLHEERAIPAKWQK